MLTTYSLASTSGVSFPVLSSNSKNWLILFPNGSNSQVPTSILILQLVKNVITPDFTKSLNLNFNGNLITRNDMFFAIGGTSNSNVNIVNAATVLSPQVRSLQTLQFSANISHLKFHPNNMYLYIV